ncbi:MarR family winged helix-turn-helix transcriptional regulator [Rhodococcus sp. NPDC056960]|uniref:MarR family winged helix-turn-helix transcriptional regulator n=1 Tax=Rhodococcus sp. NPDC056960 TaxID=3345982 RepID=UPI00363BE7C8
MSRDQDLIRVDELLLRLVRSVRRPSYRQRILEGVSRIPGTEALRVLRAVELREQRGTRPSISDVAGDLEIEQSTASRAVNAVVERGLVVRAPDADDLRRAVLQLTEAGRAALGTATANRMAVIEESTADWQAADLHDLARLLERFVARYEAVEPPF